MARTILYVLAAILGAAGGVFYYLALQAPPPLPKMDVDAWWGPEQLKTQQDKSIKPFKVKFDEAMVKTLRDKLKARHTFVPPLEGVSFQYGFNTKQIDTWADYWANKYPFAEREKFFNQYPQFKTNIQGLNIHFIRVKPEVPSGVPTVPLLLLHGWPGSVREFYEAIPLLTKYNEKLGFAVELIIPSLPGYGFSDAAVRPGLGAVEISIVMRNLMQRLGFKSYYIQGGDWGSVICSSMATFFPKEVLGYHSNALISFSPKVSLLTAIFSFYPSWIVDDELADRLYPLSHHLSFMAEESGYLHIQASKPDTIGTALSDSPTGLLTYILEKFSTWTNPENKMLADGGLSKYYTKDQLIDNLMVYWSTNSITTSMRLYSEFFNKRQMGLQLDLIPTSVPVWGIQAKHELFYLSPYLLSFKYTNLLGTTVTDDGGHFFAFQKPQFFADDVLKAVKLFREYNKNVKTEL